MAFDDKQLGTIFPTRTGTPTGSANERQMLDKTGAGGFIKSYRTLPDGTVVRLETKNGMPRFITDVSRQVTADIFYLEMDSGIVDLLSIHEGTSNYNLPGKIYQTDYVASHAGNNERAVGCGKIRTSDATGPIVPNGADSVAFPSGGNKVTAKYVPPSMFTGKMRFYVQALYGSTWSSLVLFGETEGRPFLKASIGDEEEHVFTTRTGLFTDQTTGEHYVIWPHSSSATICKLKSSAAAEKFRKFIIPASGLMAADKERVEAYILSQSIPDPSTTQTVSYSLTPTEALGYSFHFNWDGTACDIVEMAEVYLTGLDTWGFRSTHYRINFSSINGAFSAHRQVVYGPHEWSVSMNSNVIAQPTWGGQLLKLGQPLAKGNVADAIGRVYAFYRKNELVTVDVAITKEQSEPDVCVSEPEYFGGTAITGNNYYIIEGRDGVSETRRNVKKSSVTFTCDGTLVGGQNASAQVSKLTMTWYGKINEFKYQFHSEALPRALPDIKLVHGDPAVVPTYNSAGAVSSVTWEYQYDTPMTDASPIMDIWSSAYTSVWKSESASYSEASSFRTFVIVPYLDAEAVYIGGFHYSSRYGSNSAYGKGATCGGWYNTSQRYGQDYQIRYTLPGPGPTFVGPFQYQAMALVDSWNWFDVETAGITTETTAINENEVIPVSQTLVCANGGFAAQLPGIEQFFAPAVISVQQTYETRTSVNGVTHSSYTYVESGSPIFPTHFTLVGWA